MLPTFIGLGTAKAGTTWLHELLRQHPHVWVPHRRKEVNFFDAHYDEGLDWYERFFPTEADRYRAAGEITPTYLGDPRCPERIAAVSSVQRLIVNLRDPVERLHSAWGHRVRNYDYRGSFEDFVEAFPEEVERGFYGRHLDRYFDHFRREQVLLLCFETLFDDVPATRRTLAEFLGVDADAFPEDAGERTVNRTYVPRFRGLFALAQRVLRWLRRREMGGALAFIHRSGLGVLAKRLMGQASGGLPPVAPSTHRRLAARYAPDVEKLEALTGLDCSHWNCPPS